MRPIRSEILHGNCVDVRRDFDNELVPDSFVTNDSLPESRGRFCGRSLARHTAPTSKRLKNSAAGRNVRAVRFWKRKFAKSLSQAIHPMNRKSQTIKSILALFTLVCLTNYAAAGVSITQEKINQIRPGQTTEEDLVRAFGPPATKTVCPPRETALEWFYSSPISAQNYIPIIGPFLNAMQVKAWELWVVVGFNGEVKRYIAYGHYVNGEVKRYIVYGHYPH